MRKYEGLSESKEGFELKSRTVLSTPLLVNIDLTLFAGQSDAKSELLRLCDHYL